MRAKFLVTGLLAAGLALTAATASSPGFAQEAAEDGPERKTISAQDAFALVQENAMKGDAPAMLTLGSFYEQGIGVTRNYISAMEWYKKAADAGLPEGQYNLGICYEIGMGNSGDLKEAVSLFRKAADQGLTPAMQKLASLYFAGSGVPQSNKQGLEWLSKAADAGHADSANTLGVIYSQGLLDQKKDEKRAFGYFSKAAERGHLEAIKNLAVIHKDGLGRAKNPGEALKWYLIAQKGGYQAADLDLILADLRKSMKPADVIKVENEADDWIGDFRKKATEAQQAGTPR